MFLWCASWIPSRTTSVTSPTFGLVLLMKFVRMKMRVSSLAMQMDVVVLPLLLTAMSNWSRLKPSFVVWVFSMEWLHFCAHAESWSKRSEDTVETSQLGVGLKALWMTLFWMNQMLSIAKEAKSWNLWDSSSGIKSELVGFRMLLIQTVMGNTLNLAMSISHFDYLHRILKNWQLKNKWWRVSSCESQKGQSVCSALMLMTIFRKDLVVRMLWATF